MFSSLIIAVLLAHLVYIEGAPVRDPSVNIQSEVQGYLQEFGYMKPNDTAPIAPGSEVVSEALKSFQQFASLPVTGQADETTLKRMSAPRCGVTDAKMSSLQRFVLGGSKWNVRNITWAVSGYTKQLSESVVDAQIAKAWKVWSDNTNLTFSKSIKGQRPTIDILFAKGAHRDGSAFDGPRKVLAHATFPRAGTVHFDDDETWVPSGKAERDGISLFIVAAHEFGHALGLDHSKVQTALMAPFYKYSPKDDIIDRDDIAGIQAMYGQPGAKSGVVNSRRDLPEDERIATTEKASAY
ncbi:putative Matrix metalloproteinase-28 [Hypsibius exemplaris]|uniref:Matrix metalloproteinase-28 n=1 Tax=Hypsibius exemplaris TaxID=2072580 RepID=A0A9X6RKA0_HYPEX|nr:putative Matrix metalloproteinase-28 [Hypsibius exemplaris]